MNEWIFVTSSGVSLPVKSGMPCDTNGPLNTTLPSVAEHLARDVAQVADVAAAAGATL